MSFATWPAGHSRSKQREVSEEAQPSCPSGSDSCSAEIERLKDLQGEQVGVSQVEGLGLWHDLRLVVQSPTKMLSRLC